MSLIPFVTVFIFILSLTSLGFFQSYKTTHLASKTFVSYMDTATVLRRKMETVQFKKTKKDASEDKSSPTIKSEESPPPQAPTQALAQHEETVSDEKVRGNETIVDCDAQLKEIDKNKTSKRSKKRSRGKEEKKSFRVKNITDNSKLNIAPLFQKQEPLVERTLIRLIEDVYQNTPLFQEAKVEGQLSALIVSELLEAGKALSFDQLTLNRIRLKDPALQEIWHSMLKGNKNNRKKKAGGWEPLTEYVLIDKNPERLPVCLRKASLPLLKAFFGDDVTQKILAAEKKKYVEQKNTKSALNKDALKALIPGEQLSEHYKHMCDAYSETKRKIRQTFHPDTGVIAERSEYKKPTKK